MTIKKFNIISYIEVKILKKLDKERRSVRSSDLQTAS